MDIPGPAALPPPGRGPASCPRVAARIRIPLKATGRRALPHTIPLIAAVAIWAPASAGAPAAIPGARAARPIPREIPGPALWLPLVVRPRVPARGMASGNSCNTDSCSNITATGIRATKGDHQDGQPPFHSVLLTLARTWEPQAPLPLPPTTGPRHHLSRDSHPCLFRDDAAYRCAGACAFSQHPSRKQGAPLSLNGKLRKRQNPCQRRLVSTGPLCYRHAIQSRGLEAKEGLPKHRSVGQRRADSAPAFPSMSSPIHRGQNNVAVVIGHVLDIPGSMRAPS